MIANVGTDIRTNPALRQFGEQKRFQRIQFIALEAAINMHLGGDVVEGKTNKPRARMTQMLFVLSKQQGF